jgi:hypothetical protein
MKDAPHGGDVGYHEKVARFVLKALAITITQECLWTSLT